MKNADDRNFCLADYDAIGFDVDNTLAKYKLVNLMNLIYETLCELLIKRGYSKNIKDNLCTHKDFICKGSTALYYIVQINGGPHDKYDFFKDVYDAIGDFYFPPSEGEEGLLFEGVRKKPEKYLQPCSNGVKDWLMELKGDNRVVFLMTSSKNRYAEMVLETVLGSDWKNYFDIYITYAKKTGGFFTKNEKFKEKEVTGKEVDSLEPKKTYSGGNYTDLKTFLEKQTKKSDPKVVYFGDCLCSDSFPAKVYGNWDVVLVLEEMEAEGYHPGLKDVLEPKRKVPKHEVDLYIDPEEEQYILSEGMPINHRYKKFKESEVGNTDGFYPGKPKPLLSDI
uniref:5'-nucleotidase domain-containing protein 1 n=1 Tax=Magallana gigas TaxID=29159 RepID=K1PRP4_MAGGI